jgi:hypothetical protein
MLNYFSNPPLFSASSLLVYIHLKRSPFASSSSSTIIRYLRLLGLTVQDHFG